MFIYLFIYLNIHVFIQYLVIINHFLIFVGILDQGRGQLLIHEKSSEDVSFTKGSEIITNMGAVVEALYGRAKNIIAHKAVSTVAV